jgi:hypothetical protein
MTLEILQSLYKKAVSLSEQNELTNEEISDNIVPQQRDNINHSYLRSSKINESFFVKEDEV